MPKIAIVYGTSTGQTEQAAQLLAKALGGADLYNIAQTDLATLGAWDLLILGSSTWGAGELQDDWQDKLAQLKALNLEGRKVALFALGDQVNFGDTFCNSLYQFQEALKNSGARWLGFWPTSGYTFDESLSVSQGKFCGLALDNENQEDLTPGRILTWAESLLKELNP